MGLGRSKVLLELEGVPVVVRAARAFADVDDVSSIVVAAGPGDLDEVRATLGRFGVPKIAAVVEGGTTRQASVIQGMEALPECEIVLVHDGVRPLVARSLIEAVIDAASRDGAAVPVVPMQDTVKRVRDGRIAETVDRDALAGAQTPQGFRRDLLVAAIERARLDGFEGTDESALVERLGAPVVCIPGSADNLKITTGQDLVVAQALVKWRHA
jgi:2-C-methyl-D-erythritol 4-phosphate cytidylyltransferase